MSQITEFLSNIINFYKELIRDQKEQYNTSLELQKTNEKNSVLLNQLTQKIESFFSKLDFQFELFSNNMAIFKKFKLIKEYQFQKNFSVEIDLIDNHHKQLFIIFNRIFEIFDNIENWQNKYQAIKKELLQYAIFHFSFEEDIMKKYNYPEYEAHKKAHNKFIEYLENHKNENLNELFELGLFLFDWLVDHIYFIDKKYTQYFKEKGLLEEVRKIEEKV